MGGIFQWRDDVSAVLVIFSLLFDPNSGWLQDAENQENQEAAEGAATASAPAEGEAAVAPTMPGAGMMPGAALSSVISSGAGMMMPGMMPGMMMPGMGMPGMLPGAALSGKAPAWCEAWPIQ